MALWVSCAFDAGGAFLADALVYGVRDTEHDMASAVFGGRVVHEPYTVVLQNGSVLRQYPVQCSGGKHHVVTAETIMDTYQSDALPIPSRSRWVRATAIAALVTVAQGITLPPRVVVWDSQYRLRIENTI